MPNFTKKPRIIDLKNIGLVHQTPRAYLLTDGDNQSWFPKSAVEYDEDKEILTLPETMAIEKGFV